MILEVLTDRKHPDRLHIALDRQMVQSVSWGNTASSVLIDNVTPDDCRILIRGIMRLKCLMEGQEVTP